MDYCQYLKQKAILVLAVLLEISHCILQYNNAITNTSDASTKQQLQLNPALENQKLATKQGLI